MVNLVFRVLGWGFRVLGRSIFKGLEFRVCCNFLNLEIADFWLEVTRSASNFTTDMCEQNPQIPTSRSPKIGVNATSWKIWSNWAENLDTSLIIAASYCFVSPSFIGPFHMGICFGDDSQASKFCMYRPGKFWLLIKRFFWQSWMFLWKSSSTVLLTNHLHLLWKIWTPLHFLTFLRLMTCSRSIELTSAKYVLISVL